MRSVSKLDCVLVADDLSDGAVDALLRAARLPLARGAELHLLHVLDARLTARAAEEARSAASAALLDRAGATADLARSATGDASVSVATHLTQGAPFVDIIREARSLGANLVVVGRHRRRRVRDAFVGTTAERVVRKGDVPVLLVARRPVAAYRRVAAAVDVGDASRRVVELAASLSPPGTGVTLIHAYQVPFESMAGSVTLAELRRAAERDATASANRLREAVAPLGVDCTLALRRGDPALAVVREALRQRAELLVASTHARSGVAHALLGSVAEWLLRAAPCDVALTRPERFTFELP